MFIISACKVAPDTVLETPTVSLDTVPSGHDTAIRTVKRIRWSRQSGDVLPTRQPQRSSEEGEDDQRQWPLSTIFESAVGCIDHRPAFLEYMSTPREQKEQ